MQIRDPLPSLADAFELAPRKGPNVRVDVYRLKQAQEDLYLGTQMARDVIARAKVDVWSPTNIDGYQRELMQRRIGETVKYLTAGERTFPTSVLVALRQNVSFFEQEKISPTISRGYFDLPDDMDYWIIDGQHRVAAIRSAIERGHKEFEDYPLALSFLVAPERFRELRLFSVVNSRQKRVPTDVAERLLESALRERGRSGLRDLEGEKAVIQSYAVQVVDWLRDHCPAWKDMIVRPAEQKPSPNAVKAHTIISSLMNSALKDNAVRRRLSQPPVLGQHLCDYWCALQERYPNAFVDPSKYSIQKTPGLYSLHSVFPHVFELCHEARDFSKKKMVDILKGLPDTSDFWSTDVAVGDARTFGTGLKSLRLLAEDLRESLPVPGHASDDDGPAEDTPAASKDEAVARIAQILGIPAPPMSTGSTEPKEIFVQAIRRLDLEIDTTRSKPALAKAIASEAGIPWDITCDSIKSPSGGGSTVTLAGLNRVLAAVARLASSQ